MGQYVHMYIIPGQNFDNAVIKKKRKKSSNRIGEFLLRFGVCMGNFTSYFAALHRS